MKKMRERTMQKGDKQRNRSGLMSKREAQEEETEQCKERREREKGFTCS
jgi:hypothetical protein